MAVRNSLLEGFSGKFRHCWKIIPRLSDNTKCYLLALLQKLVGDFFFDFGEGNVAGNLAGILRDLFGPTK